MRRSSWILMALVVALLAGLVTLVKLPAIVAYLVEYKLQQSGFTDISIEIRDIDRQQAHINILRASQPGIELKADNIDIEYSIPALLEGQLERLDCQTLQVHIKPQPASTPGPIDLPDLPADWYSLLPVQALSVHELLIAMQNTGAGHDELNMAGEINKQPGKDLRADFKISIGQAEPLHTRISLTENGELTAELFDDIKPGPALAIRTNQLAINHNKLTALYQLSGDLARLQPSLLYWMPAFPADLQQGTITLQGGLGFDAATGYLNLTADGQVQQPTRQFTGAINLATAAQQFSVDIASGSILLLQDQRVGDIKFPQLTLRLLENTACQVSTDQVAWQCKPFTADVSAPQIEATGITVRSSELARLAVRELQSQQPGWQLKASLDLPSPTVDIPDNNIRLERLQLNLAADPQNIITDGVISAASGGIKLQFKADHNLEKQRGQADITLKPVHFGPGNTLPGQLFHRWPYPLHIETGELSGHSTASWRTPAGKPAQFSQTGTLKLDDLAGEFRDYPFSGLSANLQISGIEDLQVRTQEDIRLGMFNPGTPLADSHLRASLRQARGKWPEVTVAHFSSQVLGGTITVDDSQLDFNRERNPLLVKVEGIDIASLIALEQKQELSGTGTLTGRLPMTLGSDGLRVEDGKLYALPPGGVIQYAGDERTTELAKTNPGIELLLAALRDFHYRLLEADLDYAPDGQLLAKLRLEGNNPELHGGTPVHLNINLEENILTLLRSLQLADEIGARIGENMQRGAKQPR